MSNSRVWEKLYCVPKQSIKSDTKNHSKPSRSHQFSHFNVEFRAAFVVYSTQKHLSDHCKGWLTLEYSHHDLKRVGDGEEATAAPEPPEPSEPSQNSLVSWCRDSPGANLPFNHPSMAFCDELSTNATRTSTLKPVNGKVVTRGGSIVFLRKPHHSSWLMKKRQMNKYLRLRVSHSRHHGSCVISFGWKQCPQ
jgi:hypothetical protein